MASSLPDNGTTIEPQPDCNPFRLPRVLASGSPSKARRKLRR
jgi:hypothetical protein